MVLSLVLFRVSAALTRRPRLRLANRPAADQHRSATVSLRPARDATGGGVRLRSSVPARPGGRCTARITLGCGIDVGGDVFVAEPGGLCVSCQVDVLAEQTPVLCARGGDLADELSAAGQDEKGNVELLRVKQHGVYCG